MPDAGGIRDRAWSALIRLWGWLPLPIWLRIPILWMGNQKFLVGVSVLMMNERGEVLLFKHTYRGRIPWDLPGGWLKNNEDPARGIEREVFEESGLEARVDRLLNIHTGRRYPYLGVVFGGSITGGTFRPSVEVSDMGYFALDALPPLTAQTLELIVQLKQGGVI